MDGSNAETIKCDDDGKEIQSVERESALYFSEWKERREKSWVDPKCPNK